MVRLLPKCNIWSIVYLFAEFHKKSMSATIGAVLDTNKQTSVKQYPNKSSKMSDFEV